MEDMKKPKIILYSPKATKNDVLLTNGLGIFDNICLTCKAKENIINGDYSLDATFLIDKEGKWNSIEEDCIIKVRLDYGEEVFRIASVDTSSRDIKAFARQITISETMDMWLEDVRPTLTNGQGVLNHLKDNSIGNKEVNFYSDIDTVNTAYYPLMSIHEAIFNCDQAFIKRWPCEIQRRNYNLYLKTKIGMDRGFLIHSRKNLTGFNANLSLDSVITRIKPIGYNGIKPKEYVDSALINNYSRVKTKKIEYSDVKVKEQEGDEGFDTLEQAQAELLRLAQLEYSKNHIDIPQVEYKVNFVMLEKTEEYKDLPYQLLLLGDTVTVVEERLNINIKVRAISREFDVLAQKIISVELTNRNIQTEKGSGMSNIISDIQNAINNSKAQDISDYVTNFINQGQKESYVTTKQDEIIIADNKDVTQALELWRWNRHGLAFSKEGYKGKYEVAITSDGVINANFIRTGQLSADLIYGGIIRDITGGQKMEINLNEGYIRINDITRTSDDLGNTWYERKTSCRYGEGSLSADPYLFINAKEFLNIETLSMLSSSSAMGNGLAVGDGYYTLDAAAQGKQNGRAIYRAKTHEWIDSATGNTLMRLTPS